MARTLAGNRGVLGICSGRMFGTRELLSRRRCQLRRSCCAVRGSRGACCSRAGYAIADTVVLVGPSPQTRHPTAMAPADQRGQHMKAIRVSYSPSTGSITVSEMFWAGAFWARGWCSGTPPALDDVALASTCDSHPTFNSSSFKMFLSNGSLDSGAFKSTVTLAGYRGHAPGSLNLSGTTWTAEVQAAAFRNRDWRCAIEIPLSLENGTPVSDELLPVVPWNAAHLSTRRSGNWHRNRGGPSADPHSADGNTAISGIRWSNWATAGIGTLGTSNCTPNCATARRQRFAVHLTASAPSTAWVLYSSLVVTVPAAILTAVPGFPLTLRMRVVNERITGNW